MKDIYETLTDSILASLDDAGHWKPSWRSANNGRPINHLSKQPYNGVNILSCWVSQMVNGYTTQRWATYRQWAQLGGQVHKGAKGTPIIFYKQIDKKNEDGTYLMGRASHVFNLDQVDGIALATEDPKLELTHDQRIAHIEEWMTAVQISAVVTHSDEGRAYYRPSTDEITMPKFETFIRPEDYYSTLAHELVHWTGSKHRLERATAAKGVDTATYAKEELVAELGAAFLCADFGIDVATRDDHVNYLASWLKALKNDKRMIVAAASQASKAADMLNGIAQERSFQMREAA
jgi:antirestriction protein ArdC